MSALKIELNVALIPEPRLADKLTKLSQEVARRNSETIIELGKSNLRLSLSPHMTLYQFPVYVRNIEKLSEALQTIASQLAPIVAEATEYAYNKEEGSLELRRKKSPELIAVQEKVITALNPLREGLLLERDPGGNDPRELLEDADELGNNIRTTGYGEVGGLYRPHDTLNWFVPGTSFTINQDFLPAVTTLHGGYTAIGIFVLGPQGTCPQLLESYQLA